MARGEKCNQSPLNLGEVVKEPQMPNSFQFGGYNLRIENLDYQKVWDFGLGGPTSNCLEDCVNK